MYSGEEVYFERRQNLIIIAVLYILRQRRNRRKRRRYWIRPILRERISQDDDHHLIDKMRMLYQKAHFQYYRKSVAKFDSLLQRVEPLIEEQLTNFRHPISSRDRLYLTLR